MKFNKMYENTSNNKKKKQPLSRFYVLIFFLIFAICMLSSCDAPRENRNANEIYINGKNTHLVSNIEMVEENGKKYPMMYLKDVEKLFDNNIQNIIDEKKIIVAGKKDIVVFKENEKKIDKNGEIKDITISPRKIKDRLYLPLEELKDIFAFKILQGDKKIAIMYDDYNTTYIEVKEETKIKNNAYVFSGTIEKLVPNKKYIKIGEKGSKAKIMTEDVKVGYISKRSISSEIKEEKKQKEPLKIEDTNVILNYRNFKENSDNLKIENGKNNMCIMELFVLRENSKVDLLYDKENNSFKTYIKKLEDENIKKIGEITLSVVDKVWYKQNMQNYEIRKNIITEIINKAREYNLDGLYLNIEDVTDKAAYNRFKIELGTRLKAYDKILLTNNLNYNEKTKKHEKKFEIN